MLKLPRRSRPDYWHRAGQSLEVPYFALIFFSNFFFLVVITLKCFSQICNFTAVFTDSYLNSLTDQLRHKRGKCDEARSIRLIQTFYFTSRAHCSGESISYETNTVLLVSVWIWLQSVHLNWPWIPLWFGTWCAKLSWFVEKLKIRLLNLISKY